MLAQPEVRLLSLTGPPGVGKTRLALELAHRVKGSFANGAAFIPLASTRSADLVIPSLAQALGLHESARPIFESLVFHLRSQQRLLLLDNFEQVSPAGPPLVWLLERAPRLKLLVTSRSALRASGEYEFPLPPLPPPELEPLPPLEQLAEHPSVQLFVQRAHAAQPEFALTEENAGAVAAICARLDGLPLAIELAAARCRMLSPAAILERLGQSLQLFNLDGDPDPRHRSLQQAIAWSYDLLPDEEQKLFRSLGVFSGSFDLQAVEAVCAPDTSGPASTLELIGRLVDQSLVIPAARGKETRCRLLETLRHFALEYLKNAGELEGLRRRHAAYYLRLAEAVRPELFSSRQIHGMDRLKQEYENLRAVLEWGHNEEAGETALRLVMALLQYWALRGNWEEGRKWQTHALASPEAERHPRLRGPVLMGAGMLSAIGNDYPAAAEYFRESLGLLQEAGDRRGYGLSLCFLGLVAVLQGSYSGVDRQLEESVSILREAGDPWALALSLFQQGDYLMMKNPATARAIHTESLELFRETGDRWGITLPLTSLGRLCLQEGDLQAAQSYLEEALNLRQELGLKWFIAISMINLGEVYQLQEDEAKARDCYERGLKLAGEVGDRARSAWALHRLGILEYRRGELSRAYDLFHESLSLEMELGYRLGIARCLVGIGVLVESLHARSKSTSGEALEAARLFGSAQAILKQSGAHLEEVDEREYRAGVEASRSRLSPQAFSEAWEAGARTGLEKAVEQALAWRPEPEPPASPPVYPAGLTGREVEVLALVASGMTNAEVARQLVISQRTVEAHLRSIFSKLQVTTRSAATRFAIENDLA